MPKAIRATKAVTHGPMKKAKAAAPTAPKTKEGHEVKVGDVKSTEATKSAIDNPKGPNTSV